MDEKTRAACAWCGKSTEPWMRFCPHCGAPQPDATRTDAAAPATAGAQPDATRTDAAAPATADAQPAAPRPVCTVTSEKTATGSITVVEIYL